jgi:hypothetical protein
VDNSHYFHFSGTPHGNVGLLRTAGGGVFGKPGTPLMIDTTDTDDVSMGRSIRLNVLFEVVQNRLPTLTLLFDTDRTGIC